MLTHTNWGQSVCLVSLSLVSLSPSLSISLSLFLSFFLLLILVTYFFTLQQLALLLLPNPFFIGNWYIRVLLSHLSLSVLFVFLLLLTNHDHSLITIFPSNLTSNIHFHLLMPFLWRNLIRWVSSSFFSLPFAFFCLAHLLFSVWFIYIHLLNQVNKNEQTDYSIEITINWFEGVCLL